MGTVGTEQKRDDQSDTALAHGFGYNVDNPGHGEESAHDAERHAGNADSNGAEPDEYGKHGDDRRK